MNKILTITFAAILLSACTPTVATRGNLISDIRFEQVKPLLTTADEVKNIWGPPTVTATFDDKTWYYIGKKTETMGIFKNKTIEERIIAIKFDEFETVTSIEDIDPSNIQDIAIDNSKTDTAGKEFTFLQQLVGNLGKFNKSSVADRAAGNN